MNKIVNTVNNKSKKNRGKNIKLCNNLINYS